MYNGGLVVCLLWVLIFLRSFFLQFSSTINYDAPEVVDTSCLDADALPTIDVEAFRQVCDETARTPDQPPQKSVSSEPQTPPPCALTETELIVREGLIQTCITPRKVQPLKQTRDKAEKIHKCALKFLPFFFSREELASCNTDGSYGKGSLDATRLNNLKILLFTKFPNNSPLQKDKLWRAIKSKINAKCRASKFATLRDIQEPQVQ